MFMLIMVYGIGSVVVVFESGVRGSVGVGGFGDVGKDDSLLEGVVVGFDVDSVGGFVVVGVIGVVVPSKNFLCKYSFRFIFKFFLLFKSACCFILNTYYWQNFY